MTCASAVSAPLRNALRPCISVRKRFAIRGRRYSRPVEGLRTAAASTSSTWARVRPIATKLEAVSPVRVFAAFVGAQWIATVLLARTVRHAGWIYYQGGDQ